jgi:hypothetical protein
MDNLMIGFDENPFELEGEMVEEPPTEEVVVVCINNHGIETYFDVGVEYLAYPEKGAGFKSDSLIPVEDKFGGILHHSGRHFKLRVDS